MRPEPFGRGWLADPARRARIGAAAASGALRLARPLLPGRAATAAVLAMLAVGRHGPARAGAQQYEALADQVRLALSARIADPTPPQRRFESLEERMAQIEWLGEMGARLKSRKPEYALRMDFLRTLDYEAVRAGLDRQLVLGLIQVESAFRKYAISSAGARGYMQVMPFWVDLIGDGDVRKLFDMTSNLRYGCVILRHYLDLEGGDLFMALGRYNGSRGRPEYPNAVREAWTRHWTYQPAARRTS